MGANRNRLKPPKCLRCNGSGEGDGLADCEDCAGSGVQPTIAELRARLSVAEEKAVRQREAGGSAGPELAAELANLRGLLRATERAANGGK